MKTRDDLVQFNFSRDMLLRLHKNIIFFVTQRVYENILKTAHDLNSSIKLRVFFEDDSAAIENEIRKIDPVLWNPKDETWDESKCETQDAPIQYEINFKWPREKLLSKAISISNEAEVYLKENRLKAAETACRTVLKIRLRLLGEEDNDTACAYKSLGDVYVRSGYYDKALVFYKKAQSIYEALSNNEALMSDAASSNKDALRAEMLQERSGEEALDETGQSRLNLAAVYSGTGNALRGKNDFGRALEFYEKAEKIRENILGKDSPDTMELNRQIAGIYETTGNRQKAKLYYEKVTDGWMEKLRTDIRLGERLVSFGRYPQGAEGEILPLEWRVLDVKEDRALLITEKLVDARPYHDKPGSVTWETCALRRWMNGEFLQEAFFEEERSHIAETVVHNSGNIWGTTGERETKDRIFALSIEEVHEYFKDDGDRMAAVTPYAIKRGSYFLSTDRLTDSGKAGWWWLRSPGFISDVAAFVINGGGVYDLGHDVVDARVSVRPALWLNL